MRYTIFGSTGRIGSYLKNILHQMVTMFIVQLEKIIIHLIGILDT